MTPGRTSAQYAVRKPLAEWLRAQDVRGARILDVGCGDRRYDALFAGAGEIVGFDIPGNDRADVFGTIDAIPLDDESFDVVVCLQVLEHVPDPAAAVRELHRVVRRGGRVLLSTHGVAPLHPNPLDHWRWTPTGLEALFAASGAWTSVTVRAGAGTAATVAMVVSYALDLLAKRAHARVLVRPLVAVLNAAGEALDRTIPVLRSNAPGTLHANYHVEAVR